MCKILELKEENARKAFAEGTLGDKQLLARLFPKTFTKDPFECTLFLEILDLAGESLDDYTITAGMADRQKREIVTARMELIYKVFNGDWVADYSNGSQQKHYPLFEFKKGTGFVLYCVIYRFDCSRVSPRLCGKNEAIVKYICKHFLKEYNDYLTA